MSPPPHQKCSREAHLDCEVLPTVDPDSLSACACLADPSYLPPNFGYDHYNTQDLAMLCADIALTLYRELAIAATDVFHSAITNPFLIAYKMA
jgi:hypothetical protein